MYEYQLVEQTPDINSYCELRRAAGWHNVSNETAEKALANSIFSVTILFENEIVGMGRVTGDGSLYFYLQDIIVHPNHRKRGLGTEITKYLVGRVKASADASSIFGLIAAPNVVPLYESFGFTHRPANIPGIAMWLGKS